LESAKREDNAPGLIWTEMHYHINENVEKDMGLEQIEELVPKY